MRAAWPMRYVKGDSSDYVFMDARGFIEDYGNITDNGLIELLFRHWKTEDNLFKNHLLKRLAERLNVKLREKPLNDDEAWEIMEKNIAKKKR